MLKKLISINLLNFISWFYKMLFINISIIENDISNQKNSILDKIEYRKQKTLSKVSSQPLFSSPQLPKKNRNYGRNSNEIKEIDEENKESMEFESKKRKGKSILMLRRVSTELNSMMESLNFNKENRKMSNKKEVLDFDSNSSEKKSSSVSESHTIKLIKEVKGNNDNKKKKSFDTESVEEESENEKKELNLKKIALENKFEDEIKKLEKKMGQNKNSILISKMIEKTKKDKEKAINDLIEEFN